jgi:cysteine desulfurase
MANTTGIYLDYAATTPVSDRVAAAMRPYFSDEFANPSSLHIPGQRVLAAVDKARNDVADILGCTWKDIIFTASATESINLALRGVVKAARSRIATPHIITTAIEHSAVLETCKDLEQEGVEVTYLLVDGDGLVSSEQVKSALQDNTVLVSVMYVNNEIGTIQPIQEIAEAIRSYQILFHTDAVQAAQYLDVNTQHLGVDLMTLSGHKIYGPKGVGVLYKKEGVQLVPLLSGGPQERGMRAGTENAPAIVGVAEAFKETEGMKAAEAARVSELRDALIEKITQGIPRAHLNGSATRRVANNANICFGGVFADTLIPRFDEAGLYVSSGSACSSRTPKPSHVIEALGTDACAEGSIRFSLGRSTILDDVERAARIVLSLLGK